VRVVKNIEKDVLKTYFALMKHKYGQRIIYSILFLILINSCQKQSQENVLFSNQCGDANRIDSLIIQITQTLSVYTPWEGVDSRYRYIKLNSLHTNMDTLKGLGGVLFTFSDEKDTYKPGTISVDSIQFNEDSSSVNVEIGYYMNNNFRVNTIKSLYNWDTSSCNWYLGKTSTSIH
jgi:hypothetical protein